MADEWFAVVADKDIVGQNGTIEYKKGDVVSYGSVVADAAALQAKGLRKVSIGLRDREPDFRKQKWDATNEKVVDKTALELAAEAQSLVALRRSGV